MEQREMASSKHIRLEIELAINKRLYENNVIDINTYEVVANGLLRDIKKELEKNIDK